MATHPHPPPHPLPPLEAPLFQRNPPPPTKLPNSIRPHPKLISPEANGHFPPLPLPPPQQQQQQPVALAAFPTTTTTTDLVFVTTPATSGLIVPSSPPSLPPPPPTEADFAFARQQQLHSSDHLRQQHSGNNPHLESDLVVPTSPAGVDSLPQFPGGFEAPPPALLSKRPAISFFPEVAGLGPPQPTSPRPSSHPHLHNQLTVTAQPAVIVEHYPSTSPIPDLYRPGGSTTPRPPLTPFIQLTSTSRPQALLLPQPSPTPHSFSTTPPPAIQQHHQHTTPFPGHPSTRPFAEAESNQLPLSDLRFPLGQGHPRTLQQLLASTTAPPEDIRSLPTPAPHFQAPFDPHFQSTPAPNFQSTPALHFQSTPAPHSQSTPAPHFQSTPAPNLHSTPAPHFQSTPAPHFQSSPAPHFQSTPDPHFQSTPPSVVQTFLATSVTTSFTAVDDLQQHPASGSRQHSLQTPNHPSEFSAQFPTAQYNGHGLPPYVTGYQPSG